MSWINKKKTHTCHSYFLPFFSPFLSEHLKILLGLVECYLLCLSDLTIRKSNQTNLYLYWGFVSSDYIFFTLPSFCKGSFIIIFSEFGPSLRWFLFSYSSHISIIFLYTLYIKYFECRWWIFFFFFRLRLKFRMTFFHLMMYSTRGYQSLLCHPEEASNN